MDFKKIQKDWEIKGRVYELVGKYSPPLRQIRSKHSYSSPLLVLDEDKKQNRAIRFALNQSSPFVDEQGDKHVKTSHILFEEGMLVTSSSDIGLQQFLHIHPDNTANGGKLFAEIKPEVEAEEEVEDFEARAEAYEFVRNAKADNIAAVMFSQIGNEVFKTSTKELKRDLYVLADNEPDFLLQLADKDTYKLQYVAAQAVKHEIFVLDGKLVKWKSNGRKVCSIPVDKNTHTAIGDFFTTDDGVEVKAKVDELLKKI